MKSYVEQLLEAGLIRAKNQVSDDRKKNIAKYDDFYYGDQIKYLKKNPAEKKEDFKDRKEFLNGVNFTKHVIDSKSMLYKTSPRREIEGVPPVAVKAVQALWNNSKFNTIMLQADRKTRMNGNHFLRIAYDHRMRALKLIPWRADNVDIIQNGDDPSIIDCLITTQWKQDTRGSFRIIGSRRSNLVPVTYIYTRDIYNERGQLINRGKIEKYIDGDKVKDTPWKDQNPYGVIPFVNIKNDNEIGEVYSKDTAQNIVQINHSINGSLSDLCWGLKLQAHGQLVIKNPSPRHEIVTGPSAAIAVSGDGDAKVINYSYDIDGTISAIKENVGFLYSSEGLRSADPVHIGIDASSGVAIRLSKTDVIESRQERATLFTEFEKEIAIKGSIVAMVENGQRWDPATERNAQVTIDYGTLDLPIPMTEQIMQDEFDLRNYLTNPVKLMRQRWPYMADMTDKEVLREWQGNKAMMDKAMMEANAARGVVPNNPFAEDEDDEE